MTTPPLVMPRRVLISAAHSLCLIPTPRRLLSQRALYMVAPVLPLRQSKPMQRLEIETQRYRHDLQAPGFLSRGGYDSVITQIDSSELSDNKMVRAYDYAFIPTQPVGNMPVSPQHHLHETTPGMSSGAGGLLRRWAFGSSYRASKQMTASTDREGPGGRPCG